MPQYARADVTALKGDPPGQRQALVDGLELAKNRQGVRVVCDGWRPHLALPPAASGKP